MNDRSGDLRTQKWRKYSKLEVKEAEAAQGMGSWNEQGCGEQRGGGVPRSGQPLSAGAQEAWHSRLWANAPFMEILRK